MALSASAAANRRGIAAVTLAMAFFIVNDSVVKYVSASLPAGQLIFIRGAFCTLLLLLAGQLWAATPFANPGPVTPEGPVGPVQPVSPVGPEGPS